ncbi:MAG: OsmC family protein, partial [Planctomycetaceae bacterium]|nr:OsmC family protein [Planctomycetaceae bacterium]
AGGDGSCACAAEMLLEALIGCAGVTFAAVCTAMSIPIRSAHVAAYGDLDFRGTLGVDRQTPIGFTSVRIEFILDSATDDATLAKATQLAERYCVVAQTLKEVAVSWTRVTP